MILDSSFTTLVVPVLCYLTWVVVLRKYFQKPRFAPGPPGLPLVGNTLQVPQTKQWHYFSELGKTYGPIMQLSLGGDNVLILNKMKDANELLGKRAANYSSRPRLIYASQYQSQSHRFTFLPYDNALKRYRQAFHQMLQAHIPGAYERVQDIESLDCLHRLLMSQDSGFTNAKRYAGSTLYHLTYGKRLSGDDEEDLSGILDILDNIVREASPGAHLVDTFPILDKLPDFLSPWRKKALATHAKEMKLFGKLIQDVKIRMDDNPNLECFSARAWQQSQKLKLELKGIAYLAGIGFEAGTGTLLAAILWFFSAALLYPEKIRLAQMEIDNLMGTEGLNMPGLDNFGELKYCGALVKEVLRWQPSVPAGVPHRLDKDDVYQGYFIKKGTIIIPNIWAMHHNDDDFQDAAQFHPERWLTPEKDSNVLTTEDLLEGHVSFGWGRRVCPGRRLGSTSFWLLAVRIMWGFDIEPIKDQDGNPILPTDLTKCTSGLTSEPEEFPFKLTPRNQTHSETIERMWNQVVAGL